MLEPDPAELHIYVVAYNDQLCEGFYLFADYIAYGIAGPVHVGLGQHQRHILTRYSAFSYKSGVTLLFDLYSVLFREILQDRKTYVMFRTLIFKAGISQADYKLHS